LVRLPAAGAGGLLLGMGTAVLGSATGGLVLLGRTVVELAAGW
jgi:hypothetical protein